MRLDLPPEPHNDRVGEILKPLLESFYQAPFQVRGYCGMNHALNDITRGLLSLFPHKKAIAYLKGSSPYLAPLLVGFSREGVALQEVTLEDLATPRESVEKLKKETLFFLAGEDDPMTGALFALSEFGALLKEKKIFTLLISHSNFLHRQTPRTIESHFASLFSVDAHHALAVMGTRFRFEPLIYGGISWEQKNLDHVQAELKKWKQEGASDKNFKDAILAFESGPLFGGVALLRDQKERVWDRAVVAWEDLDGSAVVDLLSEQNPNAAADDNRAWETASGCRWTRWEFGSWLSQQNISLTTQRGLVIFDAKILNESFRQQLESVIQKIRALQA